MAWREVLNPSVCATINEDLNLPWLTHHPMHILVTGGNGFIGSHVVKQLLELGHSVRCSVRPKSNLRKLRGLPYEKVVADVRDRLAILEAVNGCDAVIHCASLSNWADLHSPELKSIILDGTRHVIDACVAQGARLIYVSSAAALGASKDPFHLRNPGSSFNLPPRRYRYAALKAEADLLCMEAVHSRGADITCVHPTETYGPGDTQYVTASTLRDFVSGRVCLTTVGGMSVAHVEDVATGIVAALLRGQPGRKYILGGENCTLSRLAHITQELCGTQLREVRIPRSLVLIGAAAMACTPFVKAQVMATKYRYAAHYWFFDTTATIDELGVEFRSATATLQSTIHWLKHRPDGIHIHKH
jgi:dihydroflavonol-4-reductase